MAMCKRFDLAQNRTESCICFNAMIRIYVADVLTPQNRSPYDEGKLTELQYSLTRTALPELQALGHTERLFLQFNFQRGDGYQSTFPYFAAFTFLRGTR
jgi:hypothetical protein